MESTGKKRLKRYCLLLVSFTSALAALNPVFAGLVKAEDGDVVYITREGAASSVVVTAESPSPVAEFAVQELIAHVEKASGVRLDVVKETDDIGGYEHRIFVGETGRARRKGIAVRGLGPDVYKVRVKDGDIYILGEERRETLPLERVRPGFGYRETPEEEKYGGTLYGVYEFLERYAGVRWLWPGELGTYVPRAGTLKVSDGPDIRHSPHLDFRLYGERTRRAFQGSRHYYPEEGFHADPGIRTITPEVRSIAWSGYDVLRAYIDDLTHFMVRHRMGHTRQKPPVSHEFHRWWQRYGDKHPEWFMMNEAGGRGPLPGSGRNVSAMCVSNPGLHRFIVEEHWDGGDYLDLSEVDGWELCRCEKCLKWDEPQPGPGEYPGFARRKYDPMSSNRYARFWKTIQGMAAKRNPDVTVTSYIYIHYLPAPTADIELSGNIYGEFVPWCGNVSRPMSDERDEYYRLQWKRWHDLGIRIAYRPNTWHYGYTMPYLSMRQLGEFLRFAYQNGMEGYSKDGFIGHWATRGPMLYMTLRLTWNPELEIEDILEEYYAAFGPAAAHVREYFDYWEEHSHKVFGPTGPNNANRTFPLEVFGRGEEILEAAKREASEHENSEYAERVEFLRLGLEHARLCSALSAALGPQSAIPVNDRKGFERAQEALERLVKFRHQFDHLYIADLTYAAWNEARHIDIGKLQSDFEDAGLDLLPNELQEPWGQWYFRKDPFDEGVDDKWYSPGGDSGIEPAESAVQAYSFDEELWIPVEVPEFLSGTEIGTYHGYGWYAGIFKVPDDWEGYDETLSDRPITIMFGAVDEQAWVYVNGVYAGEHSETSEGLPARRLWNRPFVVDVGPEAVAAGEYALVIVRMHASMHEAGIWQPVRIIVP